VWRRMKIKRSAAWQQMAAAPLEPVHGSRLALASLA
jgi:hypothetical protein